MAKIVGHRGSGITKDGNLNSLENTIASFKNAKKLGVDAIEFDVLATKDNIFVVCHDDDLERLSGQKKRISDLTFLELAEIHLLNNETVPLLYDVISLIGDIPIIIDIKTERNIPGLMEILLKFPEANITIATYHRNIIKTCKRLAPHIPVFVQRAHTPLGFRMSIHKYGADGLNVKYSLLNPFTYRAIRRRGLQVQIYTIDNVYIARFFKFLYPGIWICTNHPELLLADSPPDVH